MESTIQLNAFGYHAEISPERGANLVSLTKDDMTSVRTPASLSAFTESDPYLWGVPILLPPNRISNAEFEFEGRKYVFPMNEPKIGNFIHGFLHSTAVPCVLHRDDTAEFLFRATKEQPYMTFPHEFTMRISFVLREDGLHQQVAMRNDSSQNMPFALGFHTTFALPFVKGGRAEDVRLELDVGQEIVRNMENYLPTGETIADSPLRQALCGGTLKPAEHTLSRHFEMGKRHEMRLIDDHGKAMLRYRASEDYRYWMIYNGGRSDIMCVEPQTWINNCPNAPFDREKTGFTVLRPDEERVLETVFSLERIQ